MDAGSRGDGEGESMKGKDVRRVAGLGMGCQQGALKFRGIGWAKQEAISMRWSARRNAGTKYACLVKYASYSK